jgi:hypothetical protein
MIDRMEQRFRMTPECNSGGTTYCTAPILEWMAEGHFDVSLRLDRSDCSESELKAARSLCVAWANMVRASVGLLRA